MSRAKGEARGGRGCPNCGSHNTENLGRGAYQWCHDCNHRWVPCAPGCRGYRLDMQEPKIIGCPDCGVPDNVARFWPEAWRAVANKLALSKRDELND